MGDHLSDASSVGTVDSDDLEPPQMYVRGDSVWGEAPPTSPRPVLKKKAKRKRRKRRIARKINKRKSNDALKPKQCKLKKLKRKIIKRRKKRLMILRFNFFSPM